jgi:hypothetical protein
MIKEKRIRYKMKFNIKDINYIGIIIALLIALFVLNVDTKNKQDERCWNMLKEIANSTEI